MPPAPRRRPKRSAQSRQLIGRARHPASAAWCSRTLPGSPDYGPAQLRLRWPLIPASKRGPCCSLTPHLTAEERGDPTRRNHRKYAEPTTAGTRERRQPPSRSPARGDSKPLPGKSYISVTQLHAAPWQDYIITQGSKMNLIAKLTTISLTCGMLVASQIPSLENAPPTPISQTKTINPVSSKADYTVNRIKEALTAPSTNAARTSRNVDASLSPSKPYVRLALNGQPAALIDTTLIKKGGAAVAITPKYVDLSWTYHANRAYIIYRDGEKIAQTSSDSFRDSGVSANKRYDYQIVTLSTDGSTLKKNESSAIGYPVTIPGKPVSTSDATALSTRAAKTSRAAVRYRAFIPQKRLDSPAAGCGSYSGSKYQFGGDNRSFKPDGGTSRGEVTANIRFGDRAGLFGSSISVGATHIYSKSNGKLVAKKTASASGMWAKELGKDSSSVDVRIQIDSGNPFCTKFAPISGVISLSVYQNGTYRTISGNHKQMPSHEIYISRPVGNWATIHRSVAKDPMCLFGAACPGVPLSGLYGTY